MTEKTNSLVGKFFVATDYGVGDSHLINFYKVIGETAKSVRLQRVENEVVERKGNLGYYDEIRMVVPSETPISDYCGETEKPFTKRLTKRGSVKFEFFNAYLWDGTPEEHWNLH